MYRIYTEDKNRDALYGWVTRRDLGVTLTSGTGIWRGTREPCIVIDMVDWPWGEAKDFAYYIKQVNDQEAVLLVTIDSTMEVVS